MYGIQIPHTRMGPSCCMEEKTADCQRWLSPHWPGLRPCQHTPCRAASSDCCVRHIGACSGAVSALISLITPLPFAADFRPYFTIHDSIFAQLSSHELPSNANSLPRLLGVTNLYFLKVSNVCCAVCWHSAFILPGQGICYRAL